MGQFYPEATDILRPKSRRRKRHLAARSIISVLDKRRHLRSQRIPPQATNNQKKRMHGHGGAHFPDIYRADVLPFLENSTMPSLAPTANYLTHVNPFEAACWTAVTYIRQYVARFQAALRNNEFYFRDGDHNSRLSNAPEKLIIVIPDSQHNASIDARNEFEEIFEMQKIAFPRDRGRSALLGSDGLAYDMPSALDSFNVYTNEIGNSNTFKQAIVDFSDILRHAITVEYGQLRNAPEIKHLSQI